jgi:peptide deformylase
LIHPIRHYGDPVLRRRASEVTRFDAALQQLAADMLETMYAADGVGLAAPQIGVPLRLFVALELPPTPTTESEPDSAEAEQQRSQNWQQRREHVMVNPSISLRQGLQHGRDGCLSLPGLFVEQMPRDLSVEVQYQDLQGARHSLRAEGYFAHVLQHEYDHLEGVLFFDRLPDDQKRAFLEAHRSELAVMQRDAKAFLKRQRTRPEPARPPAR